ncbi:hypothetical protein [Massilia endophytica]|uniref:hypothetical protein n=1 Tax=Massilia endophytica TaxID=2899220 RepID=UPI001E36298E|nr:hypothetical protein [Massilia endophytica]UGQ46926.1 hypothetical protein LSQ66_00110 [Massilia endophytica]
MSLPATAAPLLDADQIAFVRGGVSISVATCGSGGLPQLVRGIGCRAADDGSLFTVFVPEPKSQQIQRDIFANGAIAVAFTKPSTHRTLQLKSREARVTALTPADVALVHAYRDAFVAELAAIGMREELVRTLLAAADEELVGLSFRPSDAFTQTPGPKAGQPLKAGE